MERVAVRGLGFVVCQFVATVEWGGTVTVQWDSGSEMGSPRGGRSLCSEAVDQ